MSRNHLPGRSFLLGGAGAATKDSFARDFVIGFYCVVGVLGVKEARVDVAYSSKAVFNNPVPPPCGVSVSTLTSFSSSSPDRVCKHGAKSNIVRGNRRVSTDEVSEKIVSGNNWK